jgi:hypothetical protein
MARKNVCKFYVELADSQRSKLKGVRARLSERAAANLHNRSTNRMSGHLPDREFRFASGK